MMATFEIPKLWVAEFFLSKIRVAGWFGLRNTTLNNGRLSTTAKNMGPEGGRCTQVELYSDIFYFYRILEWECF